MLTEGTLARGLAAVVIGSGTVLVETMGSGAEADVGFDAEIDTDAGADVVAVEESVDAGDVGDDAVEAVEAEQVETYEDGWAGSEVSGVLM